MSNDKASLDGLGDGEESCADSVVVPCSRPDPRSEGMVSCAIVAGLNTKS